MGVELMCQQCDPFTPERIIVREDATLVAVIGPSANPRGYTGITGYSNDNSGFYTGSSITSSSGGGNQTCSSTSVVTVSMYTLEILGRGSQPQGWEILMLPILLINLMFVAIVLLILATFRFYMFTDKAYILALS